MAVFVMADLHLAIGDGQKSMEVFGNRWNNYILKISSNWKKIVSDNDTVIIPGDISWGLSINDAKDDLVFLDSLPGKKILLKGNHDFWWTTANKMNKFFDENDLQTISTLSNNALIVENYIICGSRGWFTDRSMQNTSGEVDYAKIINREMIRLEMSLKAAEALKKDDNKEIVAFLHFPPIWGDFRCDGIIELLKKYNVERVYFGHIHSSYDVPDRFSYNGLNFYLISADFLNFIPHIV